MKKTQVKPRNGKPASQMMLFEGMATPGTATPVGISCGGGVDLCAVSAGAGLDAFELLASRGEGVSAFAIGLDATGLLGAIGAGSCGCCGVSDCWTFRSINVESGAGGVSRTWEGSDTAESAGALAAGAGTRV